MSTYKKSIEVNIPDFARVFVPAAFYTGALFFIGFFITIDFRTITILRFSDILFAPLYAFPYILLIIIHIISASMGNKIFDGELEWSWRIWVANVIVLLCLLSFIILNFFANKALQASGFWLFSAAFVVQFHRLTQNTMIRRGYAPRAYFYFLVFVSASLSTIYLGYSEAYRRLTDAAIPYIVCAEECNKRNLILPVSEYIIFYDDARQRTEIFNRSEIKSFSRAQFIQQGKSWPELVVGWFTEQ